MTMESPREIRIGETTYTVARFKGMKAVIAGALMSRAMREIPQLQERVTEFRRKYRERNTIVITAAMAKLPRFQGLGLGPEDFSAAGGSIELPEEPDQNTVLINVFPDLFELARKELQRFLGLVIISNRELETADDAEDVDGALTRKGREVLYAGDIDEILELLVVGAEVFKDQMASKRDRLGKIPIPMLQQILNPPETDKEPEVENPGPGEMPQNQTETEPSPSPSSQETSSTSSEPNSDGIEEPSYSESPGMN